MKVSCIRFGKQLTIWFKIKVRSWQSRSSYIMPNSKDQGIKQKEGGQTLKNFYLICRIASRVGATPYEWDKNRNTIVVTRNVGKWIFWYLIATCCLVNSCFMIVRLIQATCCMNVTYGILFRNLLSVVTFSTTTLLHLNTFTHLKQIPTLVNQFAGVRHDFEDLISSNKRAELRYGQYNDSRSPARKIIIFVYLYSCAQFLIAMKGAHNPKYIISLLANAGEIPKWKLIPFALFESAFSFTAATTLLFYTLLNLTYSRNTSNWLSVIKLGGNTQTNQIYYRVLQLLNSRFNSCIKAIVQPCVTLTVLLVNILANYATFKLFGEVRMPEYLAFPGVTIASGVIALSSLPMSAAVFDSSKEFIRRMKIDNEYSKQNETFLNSCRPFKVWLLDFYPIKRTTVLTLFRIAIDNTVILLLTF